MKPAIAMVSIVSALLVCGVAEAQSQSDPDAFSDNSSLDTSNSGGTDTAPRGGAQVSAAQFVGGGARRYPSVSLAIKLDLFTLPIPEVDATTLSMTHPVLFEVAVDIIWRLSVFVAFGTYVGYFTEENDDVDYKYKENTGVFLLQTGVRLNLMEPRPRHAHLYIPLDFTGAIGIVTLKDSTEDDMDDAEEARQERLDHCVIGTGLGMEFLIVSEFGIGAEFGLRWLINNLKDTGADSDPHFTGQFFTAFALRLAYHF